MAVKLRTLATAGARMGAGRTLPVAALLGVIVVLAAGTAGTAHFTGPRWFPHVKGSLAGPPTGTIMMPTGTVAGRAPRPHHHGSTPIWIGAVVLGLILAALAVLIWRWWSGRRSPPAPTLSGASVSSITNQPATPEPEPEPEQLLTGIELALTFLDEQREPADAVVRAWLGLQETAEESGIVRGRAETPTEFTSRILRAAFTDDRAVRTLLRLYLRTRFGDHPVSAADVTEVRAALQQLVSNWQRSTVTGAR